MARLLAIVQVRTAMIAEVEDLDAVADEELGIPVEIFASYFD